MNEQFKRDVLEKIKYRPRLKAVFTSVCDTPEQLYEYNQNLFICYNRVKDRFEIHSLENPFDSYCADLPYKSLDARTLRYVRKNDIRVRGKDIFRELEAQEAKREQQKKREFSNWVEDVGKETMSAFAKDAWTFGT